MDRGIEGRAGGQAVLGGPCEKHGICIGVSVMREPGKAAGESGFMTPYWRPSCRWEEMTRCLEQGNDLMKLGFQ